MISYLVSKFHEHYLVCEQDDQISHYKISEEQTDFYEYTEPVPAVRSFWYICRYNSYLYCTYVMFFLYDFWETLPTRRYIYISKQIAAITKKNNHDEYLREFNFLLMFTEKK